MNKRKRAANLLDKLYNRQLFGQYIRGKSLSHEPTRQLFKTIPDRLIFDLCDAIPNLGNHILMGMTRCGRLLLTYTYNSVDSSIDITENVTYRYRLHFWLFKPKAPAAKIGEVQLFDGAVVTEVLSIGIAQWPGDDERLLVYGTCQSVDGVDWSCMEEESKCSIYVTITTLPCLTGCEMCRAVAASFDEEEMAASWDCGVGLSCMKHGLTTHTHFTSHNLNALDPAVNLSSSGRVVFNTGSFLHSISVNVESSSAPPKTVHSPARLSPKFLLKTMYLPFVSDDWPCNMMTALLRQVSSSESPAQQIHYRQLPYVLKTAIARHTSHITKCQSLASNVPKPCLDLAVSLVAEERHPPKPKWFSSDNRNKVVKRATDNVYDFGESDESGCEPKFKFYRRRCKADKMYEFRLDEEVDENDRPFEELSLSPSKCVLPDSKIYGLVSPLEVNLTVKAIIADWDLDDDREKNVFRFMSGLGTSNDRHKGRKWSPLKPHNKAAPTKPQNQNRYSIQKPFDLTDEMRKEMEKGYGHQPVGGCSVKFTRRYIEVDQEITSTITDIEDDDNATVFHCALPISTHGSSYSQMEMIANSKAVKLGILCALVCQESLDIEQLCFKAAQFICRSEKCRFWFCSDYDTEIVNVCHETGDVLGVIFIRLNAEPINETNRTAAAVREDLRNFYETQCLYVWSPTNCSVFLEGYRPLSAVVQVADRRHWSPAQKEAKTLRRNYVEAFGLGRNGEEPRLMLHNKPTIPLNLILDHKNLVGFRRRIFGSRHS